MWRALGWERGGEPARAICQSVSQRHVPPSFAPSTLSASAGADAEPQSGGRSHVGASADRLRVERTRWISGDFQSQECCPVETVPRVEEFTRRRRVSRILALSFPQEGKRSSFTSFARLLALKTAAFVLFFVCFFFANVQREKCGSRASPSLFNKI